MMLKLSSSVLLFASLAPASNAQSTTDLGAARCLDASGNKYENGRFFNVASLANCKEMCLAVVPRTNLRGIEYIADTGNCNCEYEAGAGIPVGIPNGKSFDMTFTGRAGTGYPTQVAGNSGNPTCSRYDPLSSAAKWVDIGQGDCLDSQGNWYNTGIFDPAVVPTPTLIDCQENCEDKTQSVTPLVPISELKGVSFNPSAKTCACHYDNDQDVPDSGSTDWQTVVSGSSAVARPTTTNGDPTKQCYKRSYAKSDRRHLRSLASQRSNSRLLN